MHIPVLRQQYENMPYVDRKSEIEQMGQFRIQEAAEGSSFKHSKDTACNW